MKKERKEGKKGKRKERLKVLSIIALFAVAAIMLIVFYTIIPKGEEEVDKAVKKYLELYFGFTNVTIDEKKLDGEWDIKTSAETVEGRTVLEVKMSRNLTISKILVEVPLPYTPKTFMETGKGSCSYDEKITIDIYIDPYDPWSREYNGYIMEFLKKFNESIHPKYRIISTASQFYLKTDDKALDASRYFECIKEKKEFDAFRTCVYEGHKLKGKPLNVTELNSCVEFVGLAVSEIESCFREKGGKELAVDESFGITYLGQLTTPAIVIDCRYITRPPYAKAVMCYLLPSLKECS